MEVLGDGWKGGGYDGHVDGDDKGGDADRDEDEPKAPAFAHFGRRGHSSLLIGHIASSLDGRRNGNFLAVSLMKGRHDDFEVTIDAGRRQSWRNSKVLLVGSSLA